jgi:hypothetical protein
MADSLISRAMREIAKRRMQKMTPEQRQNIASKGGRTWWDNLSEEQRRSAIERIQEARKIARSKHSAPRDKGKPKGSKKA